MGSRDTTSQPVVSLRLCLLVVMVVTLLVGVSGTGAAETPAPTEPRHELDNGTFHALWSNTPDGAYPNATTAIEQIRNNSDVSFQSPPDEVGTWNRQEFDQFPTTGDEQSVIPAGATTDSDGWIEDAYVELFAVTPSTKLHTGSGTTTYAPPNGTIRAHTDYRYDPPTHLDGSGDIRISWYDESSKIEDIDVAYSDYDRTTSDIVAPYSSLPPGRHTLRVAVEIEASIDREIEEYICRTVGNSTVCDWETQSYRTLDDSVTVADTQPVSTYDPSTTASQTPLDDSRVGVAVRRSQPWQGVTLPDGETVRGGWRFYTARDSAWDDITVAANDGSDSVSTTYDPPAQPVQTHAYPSSFGSETTSAATAELVHTGGPTQSPPPTLPPNVDLSVATGNYTDTRQVVFAGPLADSDTLQFNGIVANRTVERNLSTIPEQPYEETRLSYSILEQTNQRLTVRLSLTTANGTPIMTNGTAGHIEAAGTTAQTNSSGIATMTLPRGPLTARFDPAPFYTTATPKRASDVYITPKPVYGSVTTILNEGFKLVVLLLLFFAPLFFLDRILGINLWPPWQDLF